MATASVLLDELTDPDATVSIERASSRAVVWSRVWPMVAAALAIRLVVAAFVFRGVADPSGGHDSFGWEIGWTARSVALGHGFSSPFVPTTGPTALVPPVFTYLLAGIFKVFGVYSPAAAMATLGLNSLFSALTCVPVYLSTRHSLGIRAAGWAGWAWALYPYAIYFSAGIVWEFALTALLFATCFWLAQGLGERGSRLAWAGYGLCCGVTALSNPSTLPVLLILLGLAAWRRWRRAQRWAMQTACALVVLVVTLVPWMARNAVVLHIASPVRDGFWLETWAGNAGDSSESNPAWAHPASNPVELATYQRLGERSYMKSKHDLAIAFITEHPSWFAAVTARRFLRYWTGYWSFSRRYLSGQPLDVPNVLFCIPLTGLMLLGVVRWWRFRSTTLLPYLLAIVVFPLPYYLTHASMDYRQPIESVIVVLIVAAFALRRDAASPGRWPMRRNQRPVEVVTSA